MAKKRKQLPNNLQLQFVSMVAVNQNLSLKIFNRNSINDHT